MQGPSGGWWGPLQGTSMTAQPGAMWRARAIRAPSTHIHRGSCGQPARDESRPRAPRVLQDEMRRLPSESSHARRLSA